MAGHACCTLPKCCCCCVELRIGALISAGLNLFVSSFLFSVWVWLAYQSTSAMEILEVHDDPQKEMKLADLTVFFWISVITSVVTGLAVLLDIMLLAGTINARRRLMLAWLVGYGIVYCTYVLLMALFAIFYFSRGGVRQSIAVAIFVIIQTAVVIYFWVVVRSYHLELAHQYGEGSRYTEGRVYNTVPMGDVPPVHGTYADGGYSYSYGWPDSRYRPADGSPAPPAKPPQHPSSA